MIKCRFRFQRKNRFRMWGNFMNKEQVSNDTLLNSAIRYVKEASQLIMGHINDPLQMKEKINHSDLVTEVDVQIEQFLCNSIKVDYPEHWILSEEACAQKDAHQMMKHPLEGYGWIIDPIDGTINFIHRIQHFAISVGIMKDGLLVCGVVYNPITKELYTAQTGAGAFLNGQQIHVGTEHEISDALLATGFQAVEWKTNSSVLEKIGKIVGKSRNVRILGAASLDLCLVASGRLTGFWHDGLYPWDVAAGSIIIQEAGGIITNRDGDPYHLSDHTLVASNQRIHQSLLSKLL